MPATDTLKPANSGRHTIWLILSASALAYGFLAWWFPLAPNILRAPPGDIRTFAPTLTGGLIYASLLIGLFGLLVVAFRRVEVSGLGSRPLAALLLGSLILALPLLIAYPVNATDVYGYVIRGRITSVYGENPYFAPPDTFIGDPFMPLVGEWAGETSPYGPIWEVVAAGIATVSGDNLLSGVLLFKGLALASFLAITALVWSLLAGHKSRSAYTLLWAWNPALLLTFVLDSHNDALMLLWLVLGFYLGRRGRPGAGFWVMTLAALTKPVAVLALPFFFIGFLRDLPAGRPRARFAADSLLGSALLVWLAFLPWSSGAPWRTPAELALRLLREATGGASFSPAVWVYMALGRRVPIETIGLAFQLIFIAIVIRLLWMAWRGRSSLRGAADVFLAYILSALNFRIWYAVWPFPWLLLDAGDETGDGPTGQRADYRLRAGLWFLLLSQLSVVIYGHLRVFVLGGDQAAAHLVGVPVVFALPWLLALLPLPLSRPLHTA